MRGVGGYTEGRGAPSLQELKGEATLNVDTLSLRELERAEEQLQSLGGRISLNQIAIGASLASVRAKIKEMKLGGTGGIILGVQAEMAKIN